MSVKLAEYNYTLERALFLFERSHKQRVCRGVEPTDQRGRVKHEEGVH